jgi:hypothetical protein
MSGTRSRRKLRCPERLQAGRLFFDRKPCPFALKRWTELTMNDPRDFLALARFGNLGILLLGVGLLGVLIHRKPARQVMAAGVGLLGILLLCEGTALFHAETLSERGTVVLCLAGSTAVAMTARSLLAGSAGSKRST